ncbi:hypothetical protein Tco_0638934 [Tanacetum coccineum]
MLPKSGTKELPIRNFRDSNRENEQSTTGKRIWKLTQILLKYKPEGHSDVQYRLTVKNLNTTPDSAVSDHPNTPYWPNRTDFNHLLQIDLDVLTKNIEGFKTYEDYKDDWIYEWNKDVPWVHERPWTDNGIWKEPTPVRHHWNLPGAYIVGNILRYQDLEWYEALKDSKLKEEALKNKAIMEGIIDEDYESNNEGWRRWDNFDNTNRDHEEKEYEMEHEDEERCELFDDTTYERPICNIRRFKMIKYSFGKEKEYVAIKENKYNDLTSTSEEACRAYQEIF